MESRSREVRIEGADGPMTAHPAVPAGQGAVSRRDRRDGGVRAERPHPLHHLAELEKEGEVIVYPGADHGFFCDERPSYQAAASGDAWRKLLAFFAKTLRK